jgi:hypothetical protein
MKKSLPALIITYVLLFNGLRVTAQTADNRHHDGFYVSFGLGPSLGHIDAVNLLPYNSTEYNSEYSGTPVAFDFRIGGAVKQDWILTFDMVGRSMTSPQIKTDSISYTTNDNFTISENTYGVGVSRFFMPLNVYVGATVGTGIFVFDYNDGTAENSSTIRSKGGLSWMLRAGKSWYLGRKWGLGVGMGFSRTTTHTVDQGVTEDLTSNQFLGTITVSYQ